LRGMLLEWKTGALRERRARSLQVASSSPPRSPKSPKTSGSRTRRDSGAEAVQKAKENEAVYWSMRDFEGGYSLFGSRRVFHFEDLSIRMVCFANNNQWLLAIALSNFTIHVAFVSESSAVVAATLTGHTGAINAMTWAPNNEVFCSASTDSTIRLWNNPEFECTRIVDCGVPLTACLFHPSISDVLAVATVRCMVELFNTKAARVTEQIEFAEPIRALAWTPNGKTLFMGDDKGKLNAYRYGGVQGQMTKVANMRAATRTITYLATSTHTTNPKACVVLVSSLSNMVQLCQFEDKRSAFGANDVSLTLLRKFPISNNKHGIQAAFCPSIARWSGSHNIVTGSEDGTVFIFNLEKKNEPWINQLLGHEAPVASCAWSGDGSILITADALGSVVIWLRDSSSE